MWPCRQLAVAAVLTLGAFSGCSCEDLVEVYLGAAFTADGQALVAESTQGLYLASPPDGARRKLTDRNCGNGYAAGLQCARLSPDGSRVAALLPSTGARRELVHIGIRREPSTLTTATTVALDAAFSPDGRRLVWAEEGAKVGTIRVFVEEGRGLVQEVALEPGANLGGAMGAVPLMADGAVYAMSGDSLELWYQPFEESKALRIGTLRPSCAGTRLRSCVVISPDGTGLAWQEPIGGVIKLFRSKAKTVLPMGGGFGFVFTPNGSLALFMSWGGASIRMVSNAASLREFAGIAAMQLGADSESLAWLIEQSGALKTAMLWTGGARSAYHDREREIFQAPDRQPLVSEAMGDSPVSIAIVGDGSYVIVGERDPETGMGRLVALGMRSGARKALGVVDCEQCCTVAPRGAIAACAERSRVRVFDPVTGLETTLDGAASSFAFFSDGSGVTWVDDTSGELRVAMKDGRVENHGGAYWVTASPRTPFYAFIDDVGDLVVKRAP